MMGKRTIADHHPSTFPKDRVGIRTVHSPSKFPDTWGVSSDSSDMVGFIACCVSGQYEQ